LNRTKGSWLPRRRRARAAFSIGNSFPLLLLQLTPPINLGFLPISSRGCDASLARHPWKQRPPFKTYLAFPSLLVLCLAPFLCLSPLISAPPPLSGRTPQMMRFIYALGAQFAHSPFRSRPFALRDPSKTFSFDSPRSTFPPRRINQADGGLGYRFRLMFDAKTRAFHRALSPISPLSSVSNCSIRAGSFPKVSPNRITVREKAPPHYADSPFLRARVIQACTSGHHSGRADMVRKSTPAHPCTVFPFPRSNVPFCSTRWSTLFPNAR